jgi:hypothetical protein
MEGIRIGQFSLVSNKGKHHYDCYDQNGNITGYPVTQGIAREIEILQIKNEELKSKIIQINSEDTNLNLLRIRKDGQIEELKKENEEFNHFFKWIENHTTRQLRNGIKLAFENSKKEFNIPKEGK